MCSLLGKATDLDRRLILFFLEKERSVIFTFTGKVHVVVMRRRNPFRRRGLSSTVLTSTETGAQLLDMLWFELRRLLPMNGASDEQTGQSRPTGCTFISDPFSATR